MLIAAKQRAIGLIATEETVAVVNQANRVQLRLQNMNVRLRAMMMVADISCVNSCCCFHRCHV